MRTFLVLFWRQMVRDVHRHTALAVLNVASIALGTSVYLAIQIANYSASHSFSAGVDLVAGKANLELTGQIPDDLLPKVAKQPGIAAATPIVEGVVTLPDYPGEYLHVVGVDVFTNEPFRTFDVRKPGDKQGSPEQWLGNPGTLAVTEEFANRLKIGPNETIRLRVNNQIVDARIGALLSLSDQGGDAGLRYAAMDIGWAQELLGMRARLSSIQLRLEDPGKMEAAEQSLRAALPSGIVVRPPGHRSVQLEKMLQAFRLNLTALSLVSLLVGMFLVYNTVTASVSRRRLEIGMLRAIGAGRTLVRSLFIGEALLFGTIGAGLGVAGGIGLAQLLVGSVSRTISALYVLVSIDRTHLTPTDVCTAVGVALLGTVFASLVPANEAARLEPAAVLAGRESSLLSTPRRSGLGGVICLGLAGVCSWAALNQAAPLSFGAAFFVLTGFALFAPAVGLLVSGTLARINPRWTLWRIAGENLRRSLGRTSVTAAALSSAIAMVIGVSVMIYSFRGSVDAWIHRSVVADIFVGPADNEVTGFRSLVPAEIQHWFEARPEVEQVDTYRQLDVPVNGQPAIVAAISSGRRRNLDFKQSLPASAWDEFEAGKGIFVSEPYSHKAHVQPGSTLRLQTPAGEQRLPVLGVYIDYTHDQGVILLHRSAATKWWEDVRPNSLIIYLKQKSDAPAVLEAFRTGPGSGGQYSAYSNERLRRRVLEIFDQTFAVTHILRTIAIFVAITGIVLSFGALVFERQRTIGVLRAIGASEGQVMRLFLIEAVCVCAAACVLGLAAGALLAYVLTYVVNPAFFGWTIQLQWPWALLISAPLWLIPTGMIAALFPAWQAAKVKAATAVRFE